MKTLNAKTIERITNHVNTAPAYALANMQRSCEASLLERDPSKTQYAIAHLELQLIKARM